MTHFDNCLIVGMHCSRCGALTTKPRFKLLDYPKCPHAIILCPKCFKGDDDKLHQLVNEAGGTCPWCGSSLPNEGGQD